MIRTNKGFTLIELMVVIVIIGVLAALAIPKFTDASVKAKFSEVPTVIGSYEHAQLARLSETGALGAVADLAFEDPTASSKWWSYVDPAAGTYNASTKAGVTIGPVGPATLACHTVVTAAGAITHTVDVPAATKYIPNF